jgi:hypothetical protein
MNVNLFKGAGNGVVGAVFIIFLAYSVYRSTQVFGWTINSASWPGQSIGAVAVACTFSTMMGGAGAFLLCCKNLILINIH